MIQKSCNKIYGVDPSQKITPLMVRDAIIECFTQAHKEVLNKMTEEYSKELVTAVEQIKKLNIAHIIKMKFKEVKADFNNPTKKDLIAVIDKLAELATQFRSPEIIKKHHSEIMKLINRLEG